MESPQVHLGINKYARYGAPSKKWIYNWMFCDIVMLTIALRWCNGSSPSSNRNVSAKNYFYWELTICFEIWG